MKDEPNDYLWDGTGVSDDEVARLERVLAPLRSRAPLAPLPDRPVLAARPVSRIMRVLIGLTAAAAIVLAAGAAWFTHGQRRAGWAVETLAGTPVVDGRVLGSSGRLGVGKWLETGESAKARVSVGQIGRVDVDPNTRVQLVESRGREHRMSLQQGTIHAQIWAPPKFFFVNTPSAVATDLGCAYTLNVDETGAGLVRVTHGWVGFDFNGRESFIPEGAVCATRPGVGPGTPHYDDAPVGYGEALDLLDFGSADALRRADALDRVLTSSRRRDALTLWHLLTRGSRDERTKVFGRMSVLVPPPRGVTEDAVLRGDKRATDRWWNELGLESASWWRIWIKEW